MDSEPRGARGEPSVEETEAPAHEEETEAAAHEDERPAEVASSARASSPRASSVFDYAWLVVAAVLLVAALIFLLRSHTDAAFVAATLGVCAWFLNVRDGLKRKYGLQKHGRRNWKPRDGSGE